MKTKKVKKSLFERVLTEKVQRDTEKEMRHKFSVICKNYETIINKLLSCADKDKYLARKKSILKSNRALLKKLYPHFGTNSPLGNMWVIVLLKRIEEDYDLRVKP